MPLVAYVLGETISPLSGVVCLPWRFRQALAIGQDPFLACMHSFSHSLPLLLSSSIFSTSSFKVVRTISSIWPLPVWPSLWKDIPSMRPNINSRCWIVWKVQTTRGKKGTHVPYIGFANTSSKAPLTIFHFFRSSRTITQIPTKRCNAKHWICCTG